MIVIIGESASGKSTLVDMFVEVHPEYKKVVAYTTRPKRSGEQDGVDYHFVSKDFFDELKGSDYFAEYNEYRGWEYGTATNECIERSIAVLTPAGLRALKRRNINVFSVYLHVDRRSRLIRGLERGDDIEELYRRNLSDVGQFDQVAREVDCIIENYNYHLGEQKTLETLERIIKLNQIQT